MKNVLKTIITFGALIVIIFSCCLGSCVVILLTTTKISQDTYNKSGFDEKIIKHSSTNSSSLLVDKIALINISGEIFYSVPGGTSNVTGATSDNIINQLEQAASDPKVKDIILRLNTPGGEVDAGVPICNEIKKVKSSKNVYAFIDSEAASLGYFIANCTNYIYSRPTAITGSIGVIIQAVDFYGVLEKFGGKVIYLTNTDGKNKGGQQIFDQNSDSFKIYQKILDEDFALFLNVVTEGRKDKLTLEQVKLLADGRIYSGNQAASNKLVDELGEFDEVIQKVAKKDNIDLLNTNVIEYRILSTPFSNLFGGFSALNLPTQSSKVKVLMELNNSNN